MYALQDKVKTDWLLRDGRDDSRIKSDSKQIRSIYSVEHKEMQDKFAERQIKRHSDSRTTVGKKVTEL